MQFYQQRISSHTNYDIYYFTTICRNLASLSVFEHFHGHDRLRRRELKNNKTVVEGLEVLQYARIKRQYQSHLTATSKSPRCRETCLILLALFDEQVTPADLNRLNAVLVAHMNSLQSDYAGLVVKGQFDNGTTNCTTKVS